MTVDFINRGKDISIALEPSPREGAKPHRLFFLHAANIILDDTDAGEKRKLLNFNAWQFHYTVQKFAT